MSKYKTEAKKLSYKDRKKLKDSDFAIVYTKKDGTKVRKYPIQDISHAINALARVSQFGSSAQKKKVRTAVYERYPSLKDNSAYKKYARNNEKKIAAMQGKKYNNFYENSIANFEVFSNIVCSSLPNASILVGSSRIGVKAGYKTASFSALAMYQDRPDVIKFAKKLLNTLNT